MNIRGQANEYKVFGIVTNRDLDGEKLINWHHERCDKSEEAHAIMKNDLSGGKMPSDDFGENIAWWWMMILALNLNSIMKVANHGANPQRSNNHGITLRV